MPTSLMPYHPINSSNTCEIFVEEDINDVLSQQFFRIGVIETPPFMLFERDEFGNVANPRGLVYNLVDVLATKLKFNFTLVPVKGHGTLQNDNIWNGAVGAVIRKEVDFVAADMSLTPQRALVVDFTVPFMQGSQGVVIRRTMVNPSVEELLRNHMRPFHWSIWLTIGVCWVTATALLVWTNEPLTDGHFLAIREGRNVKSDDKENGEKETWWSVLFQILGLFCQQGCSLSPIRISARVAFYTICLTAMVCYNFYTSVFISFTTVTKTSIPLNSLGEILQDRSFQIGFVHSDRIEQMFEHSDSAVYKKAWARMQLSSETFMNDVDEGMNRVYREKFAFISEVHTLEWFTMLNCSFKMLSNKFLSEGYHFMFPRHSPDTKVFSKYLKRFLESGLVNRLRSNMMPSLVLDICEGESALEAVGLDRTAGLFLCLTLGFSFAFISLWLERTGRDQDKPIKRVTIKVKTKKPYY